MINARVRKVGSIGPNVYNIKSVKQFVNEFGAHTFGGRCIVTGQEDIVCVCT